ncbi:NAD(P)-binding oxidoreductase [Pontibacter sp. G13]|uniref:NAD(P)-dependent oxidoreductase n=1 Tax=Pontibacter sp. G13 TaxID=3074898 RepID=UPI00288ADC64|nr:NAD(P)-binding oxidoreductase [Pontibacter sp. G13]WNJ17498.1 NAD(P)-binding oxidoreductase [Pontibacter sp. G13]
MERNIIVFGATGNTGVEICKELDRLGIPHSAFVRTGSEAKIPTSSTEIIKGDAMNPQEVANAFSGKAFTDVIIALGSRDFKSGEIRSTGTQHIVSAITQSGQSSKLHIVSANGVGNSWSGLKWHEKLIVKFLISSSMKDHEMQEEIAQSHAGGYHIVRPVGLKDQSGTGNVIAHADGKMPNSTIAREDVAKYLISSMLEGVSGEHSICNA